MADFYHMNDRKHSRDSTGSRDSREDNNKRVNRGLQSFVEQQSQSAVSEMSNSQNSYDGYAPGITPFADEVSVASSGSADSSIPPPDGIAFTANGGTPIYTATKNAAQTVAQTVGRLTTAPVYTKPKPYNEQRNIQKSKGTFEQISGQIRTLANSLYNTAALVHGNTLLTEDKRELIKKQMDEKMIELQDIIRLHLSKPFFSKLFNQEELKIRGGENVVFNNEDEITLYDLIERDNIQQREILELRAMIQGLFDTLQIQMGRGAHKSGKKSTFANYMSNIPGDVDGQSRASGMNYEAEDDDVNPIAKYMILLKIIMPKHYPNDEPTPLTPFNNQIESVNKNIALKNSYNAYLQSKGMGPQTRGKQFIHIYSFKELTETNQKNFVNTGAAVTEEQLVLLLNFYNDMVRMVTNEGEGYDETRGGKKRKTKRRMKKKSEKSRVKKHTKSKRKSSRRKAKK